MLSADHLLFRPHATQVHPPAWTVHVGPIEVARVFFHPGQDRPFQLFWVTKRGGMECEELHQERFTGRPQIVRELLDRLRVQERNGRFKDVLA